MPLHLTKIDSVTSFPPVTGLTDGFPLVRSDRLFVLDGEAFRVVGERLHTIAASGAALTLEFSNGFVQDVTLTANCTFTFGSVIAGVSRLTLLLRQDATGSRTVTWPGSVVWAGGTAPTLTTTASALDVVRFFTPDGGTTWIGAVEGLNFS